MKKRVSIVGIVGLPPSYGGFETLTNYLTKYNKEFKITVYCESTINKLETYNGASLIYLPLKANGFQSIFYDSLSIYSKNTINSVITFPIIYHSFGGLRHFIWDKYPYFLTNTKTTKSSYILIGCSFFTTFLIQFNNYRPLDKLF